MNLLCKIVILSILGVGVLFSPVQADDELDRQLLESLDEPTQAERPESLVSRILENTQTAGQRLAEGHFDADTTSLQQRILDDLDALLGQAGEPPPETPPSSLEGDAPPSGSLPDSPPPTTLAGSEQTGGEGAPSSSRPSDANPNAPARESAERTTPGEQTAQERTRRLGLATAVWGHLPPKEREQMRSAFSETYLPQYDELVRRYYEALATQRTDREPAADRPAP